MKIIVCVKTNMDLQMVRIKNREPVLEAIPYKVGDLEKNALEAAIQIKESVADVTVVALTVAEALAKFGDPQVQFVDVRDGRELEREGIIPGAFSAPRGMIEFWVDPESPYFKPVFGETKTRFTPR